MPINVTADLIKQYASKTLKYKGYDDSVKLYEALRVHADGDMPKDVIEERRPSESERIKEYREKIYVPITEPTLSKVITSLSKIRRSQDWSINYDADKVPGRIADNETLEEYCENSFPYFKSVTNWAFSVLLKNQIVDANAVEVIWPLNINRTAENEYYKPFSVIFNSDLVLDYSMEDYGVFLSTDTNTYTLDNITRTDGKVIYVVDRNFLYKYVQIALDGTMREDLKWQHGLGFAPMRKLGGVFFKAMDNIFVYKSRIQSMVPRLDEAARIYSDLQAEIVQHVHSDKWIYVNTECRHCNGTGRMQLLNQDPCSCTQCDGRGYVQTSPYSNLVLTPPSMGQQTNIPTPPAGYIQKTDVALMVDKIDAQVEKQLYGALSAVNMEFLAKVPLAESGVAKAYDGEETNNFVHSVAEDIVAAIDWTYKVINEYRYRDIVPNKADREAMLPSIPVPEKFDLLSSTLLLDDLEKANQTKLNPVILNEMQIEYASKKFYNDPKVKDELETIFQLDPFPNITEEEKMVRLSNGGITKEDYVISSNIQQFVRRAIEENEDFNTLDMSERKDIITGYAQEVIKSNSTKDQILQSLGGTDQDPSAALRGSVGGLTGMIEIVKAVASGVYDLDAAIALVSQRFGVSEEEARKQLGTPQTITTPEQADQVAQLT
jgi:hypothetical protein